jgi:hypothetical protein
MKGLNEVWNENDRTILNGVIGKTLDEARRLFPSHDFQLVSERGEEEVEYVNLVNVILDANNKIKGVTFG